MKKRTKEEAIEKDPVVNDLKVPNEVQRENRKVHGNGSIRPLFVHSKFSTSVRGHTARVHTLADGPHTTHSRSLIYCGSFS